MLEKNITGYKKGYESKEHPSIKGVQIIEGKNNFSINWLNQPIFCKYQVYLKYIKSENTITITHGGQLQHDLENIFKQDAIPSTFEDALETSKEIPSMSRDCFVVAPEYGIRGNIDEIWMKPEEITIIKDEIGRTPNETSINQVRAYCLAFKCMTKEERKIKAALRERGSENLFWIEEFSPDVEKSIKSTVNDMQELFNGKKLFTPTRNPKKCKICEFSDVCKYALD